MIAVFDLDGTLADISWRRWMVEDGNNKWDEFYEACSGDSINAPVVEICKILKKSGMKIAILSGRMDTVKEKTKTWLSANYIEYDWLYMRPEKDYTPDQELKRGWIKEVSKKGIVFCVFDDRDKVVKMWREEGYTCLQVAEGKF